MILIHGTGGDSSIFAGQVSHLHDEFRVICMDLALHGKSELNQEVLNDINNVDLMDLWVDDLAELVEQLGINKYSILGLSLGGMVAQKYAEKHGEGIDKLILADTIYSVGLRKVETFLKWLILSRFARFLSRLDIRILFFFLKLTSKYFAGSLAMKIKHFDHIISTIRKSQMRNYLYYAIRCVLLYKHIDFARLGMSILLITGEHEYKLTRKHMQAISSVYEHVTFRMIRGAGHVSNLDKPTEFNQIVSNYLQGRLF